MSTVLNNLFEDQDTMIEDLVPSFPNMALEPEDEEDEDLDDDDEEEDEDDEVEEEEDEDDDI